MDVTISVDEAHLEQFRDVVDRLRRAGVEVRDEMELLGIVTASLQPERIEEVRQIEGVADVEAERHYELGPPDSDLQ